LVINSKGELLVADTRNNAIRKISTEGAVSTIVASDPKDFHALLRRPIGLAVTHDDYLYVGEASHGRILQISPAGEMRGLTGVDIDIIPGDDTSARLQTPVGVAINKNGNLFITDTGKTVVHQLSVKGIADTSFTAPKRSIILTEAVVKIHPWPLLPQDQTHELVGTIGEVRGDNNGESRDHFHRGVDMQAAMGAPVVVIADEKVSSPLPAWSTGNLNEGMRIDKLSYIHMRVGRRMDDSTLSTEKFMQVKGAQGKLQAIRVKRGTRFSVGETIGTVNSMYHVHLNYAPQGDVINPLGLAFIGFKDSVAPQISSIDVVDKNGRSLLNKRRQDLSKISRSVGEVSIIVDAFDQADGNAARRRLGLYQVGYQILGVDGKPLPGYEKPRITHNFNRLPPDEEAVKVAYAEQSGITAHGNASTKFLYNVTNEIHDGHAITGFWNIKDLPAGDYRIRIHAADYAGNIATTRNELFLRLD
jgi:hypothetical protein